MTRQSPFHLSVYGESHLGGKHAAEDQFRYDEERGLFAIADGVPSLPAPRVAAEAAIEAFFDCVTDPNVTPPADARERMERALAQVNRRVRERAAAEGHLRGMASSLACAIDLGRLLVVGHVGECRVMRVRGDRLERLTREHRRGADPLLLSRVPHVGRDSREVTRAIGLVETLLPAIAVEVLQGGDGVLLASAGLGAVLDDQAILETVQRCRQPRAIVNALIATALARGARDNLTCVFGRWRSIGT